MICRIQNSQSSNKTRRHLLFAFAALVLIAGCGKPTEYVATPFSPPDEFSQGQHKWKRSGDAPSNVDNQRIGKFFKKNPDLIGSPEWTGEPNKYICKNSKSLTRFYWFSGSEENPSWNALEFEGTRARELSGIGTPGSNQRAN